MAKQDGSSNSFAMSQLICLGPKPLVNDENEAEYDDLVTQMINAAAPKDFLEITWVRDIVDSLWETRRLRRIKHSILSASHIAATKEILEDPDDEKDVTATGRLINEMSNGVPAAKAMILARLKRMGFDEGAMEAYGFLWSVEVIKQIEAMIDRADTRRHLATLQMRRHKEFALRMNRAVADVLDAEFRELPASAAAT